MINNITLYPVIAMIPVSFLFFNAIAPMDKREWFIYPKPRIIWFFLLLMVTLTFTEGIGFAPFSFFFSVFQLIKTKKYRRY